jgi:hypothetical protein
MKLGKKGSIGFIIGGILAVISSIPTTSDFIIPGQIKLFGGIALIVFGLARLLFQYENKEEQKKNQWTVVLIGLLLIIGISAYFYQTKSPEKKTFEKVYGSFEVTLNNRKCLGEAILKGDQLTLQIKSIPTDIRINGFKLYNRNVEISTKSIEWVCALMSDLHVIRCSTGLDLPKNNFEMFVDKNAYTIMYWMWDPLENIKISDISFAISTDKGEHMITIADKK